MLYYVIYPNGDRSKIDYCEISYACSYEKDDYDLASKKEFHDEDECAKYAMFLAKKHDLKYVGENAYLDDEYDERLEGDNRCSNCHYAYYKQYGYSNYTVEGCNIGCSLNLNSSFPRDRFYGNDIQGDEYANICHKFSSGTPSEYAVEDKCPFE